MSTILHIPSLDALPDTPADLLSFTNDDGRDEISLEFAPGYSADEQAWFADELRKAVLREVAAVKVVRHAEDIARQAVTV